MAICMLLWKKKKKKTRQNQVLIDGLLENHVGLAFVWRRTREILPWLSFNPLISRLCSSLCMVSGCFLHINEDEKSWSEDLPCQKRKKIYLFVIFPKNGYFKGESPTPSTHWSCLQGTFGTLNLLAYLQKINEEWPSGKMVCKTILDLLFRWLDRVYPATTWKTGIKETCSL